MRKSTPADFWKRVSITPDKNECWNWTGAISRDSKPRSCYYGQVGYQAKHYRSHRLAYILSIGEIPSGKEVCHTCDNPLCCNPSHLYAGTHQQNLIDAQIHGKWKNSKAKQRRELRQRRVERATQIKEMWCSGLYSMTELGKMFGITLSGISRLISRDSKSCRVVDA